MTYIIQAFITKSENSDLLKDNAEYVILSQDFILIPLNKSLKKKIGVSSFLFLVNNNDLRLLHSFELIMKGRGKIAYIEAEFFGGEGVQASVVFENEKMVMEPEISKNAINKALDCLGVRRNSFLDEFDSLELGKHRNTEAWVLYHESTEK